VTRAVLAASCGRRRHDSGAADLTVNFGKTGEGENGASETGESGEMRIPTKEIAHSDFMSIKMGAKRC